MQSHSVALVALEPSLAGCWSSGGNSGRWHREDGIMFVADVGLGCGSRGTKVSAGVLFCRKVQEEQSGLIINPKI